MSNDKIRNDFEAWAKHRYSWHLHEDARDSHEKTLSTWDGHKYGNRIVEGMWQAWQASHISALKEAAEFAINASEVILGGSREERIRDRKQAMSGNWEVKR